MAKRTTRRTDSRSPRTEADTRAARRRRTAIRQSLGKARRSPSLPDGGRTTRDDRRPCCRHCVYAARMREGRRVLWICANTPDWPGGITRIKPGGRCPNFRRRRCPVVHANPPDPPNDEVRFIPLTHNRFAIVDAADYESLSKRRWCVTGTDRLYACRRENGKTIYMHRQISKPPKGMIVDHINGCTLDNRSGNLRNCTHAENMRNRRGNRGRTLFKGVTWQRHCRKYKATIGCNGRPTHIGYYDDPIEAARAYDRKAQELFGEFARLNFPEDGP